MNGRRDSSIVLYGFALVAISAIAFFAGSCGDEDSNGNSNAEDEVRQQLNEGLDAARSGDAEKYLAHVTEDWLATVFGTTEEEVRSDPSTFQLDNPITIASVKVSGKTATIPIDLPAEGNLNYNHNIKAVKEGDNWRFDRLYVSSPDSVPADARKVNVEMNEWAFSFDPNEMTSDKQLVLRSKNTGKVPHMLVLVKISEDANLRELLELEEPNPQGKPQSREELGAAAFFWRGEPAADVVITERLAPGRYAFLCFVRDAEDGLEHVAKGMYADFTVK